MVAICTCSHKIINFTLLACGHKCNARSGNKRGAEHIASKARGVGTHRCCCVPEPHCVIITS